MKKAVKQTVTAMLTSVILIGSVLLFQSNLNASPLPTVTGSTSLSDMIIISKITSYTKATKEATVTVSAPQGTLVDYRVYSEKAGRYELDTRIASGTNGADIKVKPSSIIEVTATKLSPHASEESITDNIKLYYDVTASKAILSEIVDEIDLTTVK